MRSLYVFLILVCYLVSCNQVNFNSEISIKVKQICSGDEICKISMTDIISKPWEKMYVFKESVSLEEINQVLGFRYKYFEDIGKRIVFVNNNEVVYYEDEFPSADIPRNGELFFNFEDSVLYKIYNRNDAVFSVEKVDFGHGVYYILTHSK